MRHAPQISPCGCRVLVAAIGVLGSLELARADDPSAIGAEPEPSRVHVIPPECHRYTVLPADARDPAFQWQQALSLAACLQDGPALAIRDPGQLDVLVEEMAGQLELPMLIYLEALAQAPAPVQLRAAFHIGLAFVALSTRARSAIAAPPDLATNEAAARRYRELHARLEPLLVPSRRAAWLSFTAIDESVAQNPALASDAVALNMIRTARAMLAGLRDVAQVRPRSSPQLPGAVPRWGSFDPYPRH